MARLVRSRDMPGFHKVNHILIDLATKVNKIVIGRYNIMHATASLLKFFFLFPPPTHIHNRLTARSLDSFFFFFFTPGLRTGSTHLSCSLQLSTILVVLLLTLGCTPSSCPSVVCVTLGADLYKVR